MAIKKKKWGVCDDSASPPHTTLQPTTGMLESARARRSTIYMPERRAATDDGDAPKKKITLDDMVMMHHGDPRIRHGVADGTTRHVMPDAPKQKMPPMQSTPHASDAAGWSSDPSLKLSPAMLADLESIEALPALPAHLVKHEKDGFETL